MQQYKKILGKVMMTAEGTYNSNKEYDPISLITDEETGKSYISRKEVPAGTQINNREYWQPVASSGIIDNGVIILNRKNSDGQVPIYDLQSATEAIAVGDRKGGVILGFLGFNPETDTVPTWKLYQYNDVSPSNWTNIDYWLPMDYTNKYAGWFDNEEALYNSVPFPKIGMYAYVGNSVSSAIIYRCYNDRVWHPTEDKAFGGVVNLADEEDITSKQNKLKFKDKEYNPAQFSGLGKLYLRKNVVDGKNILTQTMMQATNTIYIIQYDYDLQGETITIPEGCTLDFQGGCLNNGTIVGNNTDIQSSLTKIFGLDIELNGGWNVIESYPEWFGAKGDGVTNDSDAIGKAVNISSIVIFDGRKEYMFGYIHVTSNTIMYCNNAKFIHAPINVNQPDFIWVTNAKLIIKDAIIDGNPSFYVNKQNQYYLLHASTKGSLEVYNCHFKNVYGNVCSLGTTWIGTNISDYAWDCKVINCKFDLYTDFMVGGDAINSAKCNGITIEGNTINGGLSGIRLQLYCKNIKVCNNIVKNINRDVAITIAHSEDSIVDNNICCGCYSNGIEIRGVVTCKVTNNKVYDNGACGIALAYYTIGVTSDSNYFGTVSEKYPNVPGNTQDGSGTEMPCLETNVDNNLFYNNASASYFYKSTVTISNNEFREPVNENNCQVVVSNDTTPYSKLYFSFNSFYCNITDVTAILFYNNETNYVTFGRGNKVFNCRKLGNDVIIGENIEIDLFDKLSLYDSDNIDYIKVSSNGVAAMFDNLSPGAKLYHIIVKAASSAGNITFIVNRYKADGTFVATELESTKNIGTDFTEINLYFRDTTKDYTDRYTIEFNGAESTPIIVKECCIYSITDNKATLVP